jgi:hypothetical protein
MLDSRHNQSNSQANARVIGSISHETPAERLRGFSRARPMGSVSKTKTWHRGLECTHTDITLESPYAGHPVSGAKFPLAAGEAQ